jgi:putative membrane protein
MDKRRDSFIEFFHYNFNNIKNNILPFLGLIISSVGSKGESEVYIKFAFYLLIIFILLFSFLKWYFKTYEMKDDKILISEGIFKKRKNDIAFNRIKSINTSDSILKRVFKISNFNLEVIGGKKLVFVIKNKEIQSLKQKIITGETKLVEETNIEDISFFSYVLLMMTNPVILLTSISITAPIISFIQKNYFNKENEVETSSNLLNEKISSLQLSEILSLNMLYAFTILFIPIVLVSLGYAYLTFAKFSILSSEKEINIEYGILNRKKYHIPKRQIRGLRIYEPLTFRIFGYAQLKVDNIGLNEKSSSSIILYPIMKKENIDDILKLHLPSFKQQEIEYKAEKSTLPFFIMDKTIKFVVIISLLSFLNIKFLLLSVFIPILIGFGYTSWKNSGLSFNDEYITVKKTYNFKILTLITLKKYTETTSVSQTILMKNKNKFHYSFAVYSERLKETYQCKYLSDIKKDFLNYLK